MMPDGQTLALARMLGQAIEDEPFDVQMAALEIALAIVLLRARGDGGHPHFLGIGARMIQDHINALTAPGVLSHG